MSGFSGLISCYVPYLCALAASLTAYLLAGDDSPVAFVLSFVTAVVGAVLLASLAASLGGRADAVFGLCSPLVIGANILGSMLATALLYGIRDQRDRRSEQAGDRPL